MSKRMTVETQIIARSGRRWISLNLGSWPRIYLIIALPVALILSFSTQVFRSLDESPHFLRVAQILSGSVMPVLGPNHHSSGSYQSKGVVDFAHFYGEDYNKFLASREKTSLGEIEKLYAFTDTGETTFVEHSNTTIYLPSAYSPALVGMLFAKVISNRPLVWFYAARVADALAEVALTAVALSWAGSFAPVLFVIALIPIVLFQSSAISADAFLMPTLVALAGIMRLSIGTGRLSAANASLIGLFSFIVGTSKFAYLPLIAIPLALLFVVRQRSLAATIILVTAVVATSIIAFWWGALVKPLTFTMRIVANAELIDVGGQMAFVFHHPVSAVHAIWATLLRDKFQYFYSFFGARLGWFDIKTPIVVPLVASAFLLMNVIVGQKAKFAPILCLAAISFTLCSMLLVFLLLYLQWNFIGAEYVEGVQGRYFLPLAPLLFICLPRYAISDEKREILRVSTMIWGLASAVITTALVIHRYWLGSV